MPSPFPEDSTTEAEVPHSMVPHDLTRLSLLATLAAVLLALGCLHRDPKKSDLHALERARFEWGHALTIEAKRDLYFEGRARATACPTADHAEAVLATLLRSPEGGRRSDSDYVYVNFWDQSGEFCFQLYYEAGGATIGQSNSPYC